MLVYRSVSALFCFDRLQCVKDKLNNAVIAQWRQSDQLRGCRDTNPKSRMRKEIHNQQTGGLASSLDTLCSTPLSLVNVSLRSSFISLCKTSSCVAMCSTALVRRITASRASSDLRLNPIAPIAATEIEAPATAAMTSIMTATSYKGSLSTLSPQFFLATSPWTAVLAVTITSRFRAPSLVFQPSGASFSLYSHQSLSRGLIATKQ